MAQQTDKDIEDAVRRAAETAEGRALREHISYAIAAYVNYLSKNTPGFNVSVTIGTPTSTERPTIAVYHPWEFRGH